MKNEECEKVTKQRTKKMEKLMQLLSNEFHC